MYLTDDLKNIGIDAMDAAMQYMSLHTAYSATGSNEVTGGSYVRQATARNASASGEAALTATENIPVPATSVAWVGWWSAETNGTFYAMAPNYPGANAPVFFLGEESNDTITSPAHGLSDTNTIIVFGGNLPTGLTQGTIYYVRDAATDTFKVETSVGGGAVNLTVDGWGFFQRILVEVYAAAGTHQVTAAPFNLNLVTT